MNLDLQLVPQFGNGSSRLFENVFVFTQESSNIFRIVVGGEVIASR